MNPSLLHIPPSNQTQMISLSYQNTYLPFKNFSSTYTYHQPQIPQSTYTETNNTFNNVYHPYQPYNQYQNIFNNYILQNSQFFITNYHPNQINPIYNQSNTNNYVSSSVPSTNDSYPIKNEHKKEKKIQTSSTTTTTSIVASANSSSSCVNKIFTKKRKRMTKLCTACPHKYAVHYAKNMCSNCYHVKGRNKKPWNCSHTNKSHYALGLCQNCYQMNYNRKQTEIENISIKDELATNTGTSHTFT